MLEQTHPRLYQWVKPRSLGLHLLFVLIASGCMIAGWWQVNRAMQGNTLSYLYSVEWPAFAVVAGIGWWQMFHDTPEDIAERRAYHERMRAASAEVVARTLPRSARALTVDSSDAGSRSLGPAATRAVSAGAPGPSGPYVDRPGPSGPHVDRPGPSGPRLDAATGELVESPPPGSGLVRAGEVPVARGGAGADPALLDDEEWTGPEDQMTEYNRYLALLALKGKAKTWRNPHGT